MRRERDFLGEREIPGDAYYGIQTLRAIENFPITGGRVHPEWIKAVGLVKKACAQANMELGYLPQEVGNALVQAADEVAQGRWLDQFLVDPIQGGAGTSLNMNANEVIANRALELLGHPAGRYDVISPNSHVNMAQSTNDVLPTALNIALLVLGPQTVDSLRRLAAAFFAKGEEVADVVKVGRTHLQDAVPMPFRRELEAYGRVLERDADRIEAALDGLRALNIGGTAVGTGLNADPAFRDRVVQLLREATGFDLFLPDDLVDRTQNVDGLVTLSHALKGTAVNLCKIANDLRLMASGPKAGLAELRLPPRQPGSSIMPGKVNPVIPEVANQVAFQIIGNDLTVTMAAQAGQFELNVMVPVLAYNLLQSTEILGNVCRVFRTHCVEGMEPDRARMRYYLEQTVGVATALNPYVGYEKASEVAKEALQTGEPVWEIVRRRGLLSEEQIEKVLGELGIKL